jgi:hypothetical protein
MASESNSWITPDGSTTLSLDATSINGLLALDGRAGIYFPPVVIQDQRIPLQPGSIVRYIDYPPRPVLLPLGIKVADEAAFTNQMRNLAQWFETPAGSPGTYRRMAADGSTRDLYCYYQDGLMGTDDQDTGLRGAGWMRTVLSLYANDPFWYDPTYTLLTFVPSSGAPTFLPALIPILLGFSGILSGFSISNTGDYEAWPIWTIHGPGTNPTLTNNTTGKVTTFTKVLGSSDVLVVDTRPLMKSVTLNGAVDWSFYNPTSSLWPLAKGQNNIAVAVSSTGANSLVQCSYKQRYKVS